MMDRKEIILARVKAHQFVKDSGGSVGIVGSYGKGAATDIKADTQDIIVTANTADIDLEDERVIPSGADMSYFIKNRQMFADHRYDIMSGAAYLRTADPYPSASNHRSWKLRTHLRDNDIGKAIAAVVDDTSQIGISIGFVPMDFGPPTAAEREKWGGDFRSIVRTYKVFEASFTLLPCNVSCQSEAIAEGKSLDMVDSADRLLCSSKITRDAAHALGMPISKERKMHAIPKTKMVFLADGSWYKKRVG